MYSVIEMYGDYEPWWFLDGWEVSDEQGESLKKGISMIITPPSNTIRTAG